MTTRTRFLMLSLSLVVVLAATALDGRGLLAQARARWQRQDAASLRSVTDPRPGATERQVTALQERLRTSPDDPRLLTALGGAYLQRARDTGDASYYTRAEQALRRALARQPDNVDALTQLGVLALARHQFREARGLAEQARTLNPDRALIYGILGDALVELGEYPQAVATVQRMVDLRPNLSSYARVSYLRELHGDIPGAIDAMQRAVRAGGPAAENAAWTQTQLALLYFNQGDLVAAEAELRATLSLHSSYIPAQVALARVHAARGEWEPALQPLRHAVDAMPLPEYAILLGDVYRAAGRPDEAATQDALVRAMAQLQRAGGMAVDLEMALFEADHGGDPAATVALARRAYADRPSIHSADTLAWALYRAGRLDEARLYSHEALRLGTRDALLHYHAGMIALAAGDQAVAREHLDTALSINPYFSLSHAPAARAALDQLGVARRAAQESNP